MPAKRVNKVRMIKMYLAGEHVYTIAEELGCKPSYVWKTMGKLNIHRPRTKPQVHKRRAKAKPKPAEPMYREIPQHIPVGTALDKNEAELKRQRIAWQLAHKVWYL